MRDHSPVKLRNEINIKIDNSNRDKKIKRKSKPRHHMTEEEAIHELDNLYYDNHAILTQHNQGQARGSGGSIILPDSINKSEQQLTSYNNKEPSQNYNPNTNPNLYSNYFNSLMNQLKNSSSSSINTELAKQEPSPSSEYNPYYTNPSSIINAKSKKPTKPRIYVSTGNRRGRPSKKTEKPNEPSVTEEVKFESPVQQTGQASHSIFDNPESQPNIQTEPTITEPEEPEKITKIFRPKTGKKKIKTTSIISSPDRNVNIPPVGELKISKASKKAKEQKDEL
jgi:hypothetical protein